MDACGGQCKVNWPHVCQPLDLGGLGIRDLQRADLALCAQWIWLKHVNPNLSWSHLPLTHSTEVHAIVHASTSWHLGDDDLVFFGRTTG